jgi:SAM-dependent methyltransferase
MTDANRSSTERGAVQCPLSGVTAEKLLSIPVDRIVQGYEQYRGSLASLDIRSYFNGADVVDLYGSPTGYRFFHPFDIAGDEQLYRDLSALPWYYKEEKWEYDVALESVGSPNALLEVGCGRGAFLRKMHGRSPRVVGLELNDAAAASCRDDGLDVWTRPVQDVAAEDAGAFDAVVSFQVLEHIAQPLPVLEAACELLTPGGRLVLSVPNNDSYLFDEFDPLNVPPHHMGLWNLRSLLWLQQVLPIVAVAVNYQPLAGDLPLHRLATEDARRAYNSSSRRLVTSLVGEGRIRKLAKPWIEAALALAPGHSIQVVYERLA